VLNVACSAGILNPSGAPPTVKFSLNGNRGLDIFATNFPKSERIGRDSQAPVDDSVPAITAGSSGLSYDSSSDRYSYVWKSDK
jgi:hypothetical protein